MLDFYLNVSDYGDAYDRRWLALANRLIPPNVFPFEHQGLIAKYAVLSEGDFDRLSGPETRNVSVWADRKSVVEGKSVSVRVAHGGCRILKKTKQRKRI